MSYMPAEEDDYDSEDGFIGSENYDFYLNNDVSPSKQRPHNNGHEVADKPGHQQRQGFTPISKPSERQPVRQWVPSSNRSWAAYGGLYSLEDMQKAAKIGVLDVLELCVKQGLSVDTPLQSDWTALMYAANHGQAAVVTWLLQEGADAHYHADQFTALMAACNAALGSEEDITDCVRSLLNAGTDVNAKDRYHMSPLMMAGREGHLGAVKLLLQHGANINAQDSRGWTALTWSTQRQRFDLVTHLLDNGADPDILHLDRLTVKDLAAHLATDQILAVLERRPAKVSTESSNTRNSQASSDSPYCILEGGELRSKLTDLRYGELEVFLIGLDLATLVPVFQEQLIDLNLLMTLTEQDLINAGVSQVGARKKLLDAIQAVHGKDWEPTSLVSIHFNRQIRCADAVAMVANSSKQLRYIGSTMVYVREHLHHHPESIMQPTDKVSPSQLLRYTEDAHKNAKALCAQLVLLQKSLNKEMRGHNPKPPDCIGVDQTRKSFLHKKTFWVLLLLSLSVPVLVMRSRQGCLLPSR